MKKLMKEFKDFAFGGTLIEVAVALVMALALVALIGGLVDHVLMPIVGILFGEPNFNSALVLTINDSEIRFGSFLTELVTFIGIALAVYFFVVKPYKAYQARVSAGEEEPAAGPSEIDLLTEIRDSLAKG